MSAGKRHSECRVAALLSARAISLSPPNELCSMAVIRTHLYTHLLSWQDPGGRSISDDATVHLNALSRSQEEKVVLALL